MALILERKEGESIVIILPDGRTGRLTITSTGRSHARVAIDLPSDVTVLREELTRAQKVLDEFFECDGPESCGPGCYRCDPD